MGQRRAAGARAVVTEVTAGPGTLLVGLEVTGTPGAREEGGTARRWQVLTVSGGRIADIRGFGDRAELRPVPVCLPERSPASRRGPMARPGASAPGAASLHRSLHLPGRQPGRRLSLGLAAVT